MKKSIILLLIIIFSSCAQKHEQDLNHRSRNWTEQDKDSVLWKMHMQLGRQYHMFGIPMPDDAHILTDSEIAHHKSLGEYKSFNVAEILTDSITKQFDLHIGEPITALVTKIGKPDKQYSDGEAEIILAYILHTEWEDLFGCINIGFVFKSDKLIKILYTNDYPVR
jgi:hypothetical protein